MVTQNLKDGPPPDEDGVRIFEGVMYLAPNDLLELLDLWGDSIESRRLREMTGQEPAQSGAQAPPGGVVEEAALLPSIRDFLLELERRRGSELPPPAHGD